jgi:hypothetical protein
MGRRLRRTQTSGNKKGGRSAHLFSWSRMLGTIDGRNIVAFFPRARDFLPVFRGFGAFSGACSQASESGLYAQEKY